MSGSNFNVTTKKPYVAGSTDIAIADGGTGTSTAPTSGQLLIGKADNSYAVAALTAGANISITPGDGTITIAGTASGTVTSVNGDAGPAVTLDLDDISDGTTYSRLKSESGNAIFDGYLNRVYSPGSSTQFLTFTLTNGSDSNGALEFDFGGDILSPFRFDQKLSSFSQPAFKNVSASMLNLPGEGIAGPSGTFDYPYLYRIDADSTVVPDDAPTLIMVESIVDGSVELPHSSSVRAGHVTIIKDVTGTAGSTPITISVQSGDEIDNVVDATYVINTNYGEVKFVAESTSEEIGHETDGGWWTLNGQPVTNAYTIGGTDVAVADGGTGVSTTPANGELLIGNGTGYTVAALTAGANISITPGAGSISIAATMPVNTTLDLNRSTVANTDYTVLTSDMIVEYTSLTVTRTVTLPAAATATAGKTYFIKDGSGSASPTVNIVVDGDGAETIDGAASVSITAAYGVIRLYSTGTAWMTL